jgi:uracil-DNA glycosylase
MPLLKTLTNSAPEWANLLQEELKLPYFEELSSFLEKERSVQKIFPPENLVFECFRLTPPKNLKVVLLGQDPYHGDNQAHDCAFLFLPELRFHHHSETYLRN